MIETTSTRGALQLALNSLVVRVYREVTGRGATRVRAVIGQDTITLVLEDTLTPGERSLVRLGRRDEVRAIRRAFQEEMAGTLTSGVEELTGRTVVAFMSAESLEPDYAAEVFVLGPAPPRPE